MKLNTLIVMVIIILFALTLLPIYISRKEWYDRYPIEYAAWCKLENRTDLTYEEWYVLRQSNLLNRK